jgi:hypothetical protein
MLGCVRALPGAMPIPFASKPVFYGIWEEAVSVDAITIVSCAAARKMAQKWAQ